MIEVQVSEETDERARTGGQSRPDLGWVCSAMIQVSEEKDERARMGGQWILEREPHFALPEPE